MEQRAHEVRLLEQRMLDQLDKEAQARKDFERKMTLVIEQRASQLRSEIAHQARSRVQNIEEIEQSLAVDFPKIQEQIIQTSIDRQDGDNELMKRIQEQSSQLLE
jgi:hypothetical protein